MRRRTAIEVVYADNLVVRAGREVAAIGGESDGVNRAEVMAHMAKLPRFGVGRVVRVVYRIGRPDSDVTICQDVSEIVQEDTGVWQGRVVAYHRQLLLASSRPGIHDSCRPRNPSARLSHSTKDQHHHVANTRRGGAFGVGPTTMAEPGRLDELHVENTAMAAGSSSTLGAVCCCPEGVRLIVVPAS